jgi:hypothetical protein
MKHFVIISDRQLITWSTKMWLCVYIASSLNQYDTRIILLAAIILPFFLTPFIFDSKKFKRIVFKDEKYPDKKNSMNFLILLLFGVGYCLLLAIAGLLEYFGIYPNWYMWTLFPNIILLISVFSLFINRICSE